MEANIEQDIPFSLIIAGGLVLIVGGSILRRFLRKRDLQQQGQIDTAGGRIPTIEERVAKNKHWVSGNIPSKGRTLMVGLWIVALLMNFFIDIGFIKSFSNPTIPTGARIVLGIFVLISLAIGFFAVRNTMQHLRFGESRCRIQGKAGVVGKKMTGVITTTKAVEPKGDYTIILQCYESYSVGHGKNRRTQVKTHHQSEQKVPSGGKNSTLGIPFSFDIPNYAPETAYQISRGAVQWQLRISAPLEGVDYGAAFEVPVFKMDYST